MDMWIIRFILGGSVTSIGRIRIVGDEFANPGFAYIFLRYGIAFADPARQMTHACEAA